MRRSPAARGSTTLLLALLTATLYLSTLTWDHSLDAVVYAANAESAVATGEWANIRLWNPAHVLHTSGGALVTAAAQAIGVPISGLMVLQLMSALGGAVMAALLHRFLVERTGAPWMSTAAVLALAVSGGVWAFAVQGEPNLPALCLAAAALFPVARLLTRTGEGEEAGWGTAAAAGILLGLAAALHLTLGTLWIAMIFCIPWRRRGPAVRCLAALGVAGTVLAAAYLPRGLLLLGRDDAGILDLVTFAGASPYPSYLGRTPFDPLGQLGATITGYAPAETASGLGILAMACRIVPLAWLGALAVAPFRMRAAGPGQGRLLTLSALWFLGNVALYAGWAARNFEFASFLLVPLAVGGTLGLGTLLRRDPAVPRRIDLATGAVLAAAAAATAVAVGFGITGPGSDPDRNRVLEAARLVERTTAPVDHVLVAGGPETRYKVYIPYFAGRKVIVPDFFFGPSLTREESMARLRGAVSEACGRGEVWALGEVAGEGGLDTWERIPYGRVREWVRTLEPRPAARTRDGTVLWRLEKCPF